MLQAAYDAGRIKTATRWICPGRRCSMPKPALTLNTSHQDRLDSYKITLGLPPDTPVRIQDDLLNSSI